MLYVFCSLIFLASAISGLGQAVKKLFKFNRGNLSDLLICGIVIINLTACFYSFFRPLNIYFEVFVICIGIGFFFYHKVYNLWWEFFKKYQFSFVFISLVVGSASSFPFILDHFGYYEPTILWLRNFGLLKGISNLDLLLGQMSFWHIFQATFSNFIDAYLRINAFVVIIYIVYAFEHKKFALLLFIPIFSLFVQSPSPDLPVIVFSLILLNDILEGHKNFSWLLLLACYIFAIKPTMVWPLFLVVLVSGKAILKLKILMPSAILLTIFIFKNLWCFGFPVFPLQILDFGISWKPSPEVLRISSQYAVQKTYDMQYSIKEIQNFSFLESIMKWFTLKGIKSIINSSLLIMLIVFAIFVTKKKNKLYLCILLALIFKTILVLSFSAQYRFFLDVFFAVIFVLIYKIESKKILYLSTILAMGATLLIFFPNLIKSAVPSFKIGNFMMSFQKEQLVVPMEYKQGEFSTYTVGNLTFNIPKNYPYCYKTPLPAISPGYVDKYIQAGIFPQKFSNNLKSGFYWKKISPEEQEKLRQFLKESGYNKN